MNGEVPERATPNKAAIRSQEYAEARKLALASAQAHLRAESDEYSMVRLTLIDEAALSAWRVQWGPLIRSGDGGWDWVEQRRLKQGVISRFEVAIWHGSRLCGLALGKPSNGDGNLSVHLLEGCPERDHPLKGLIAYIGLRAAETYAIALGKQELHLIRPLSGALSIYQAMGFDVVGEGTSRPYCKRRL